MLQTFASQIPLLEESQIDTPYEYPITPDMKEEWLELSLTGNRWEACEIPEDILSRLTTSALVETVANYPLMVDLFAFDTIEEGYQVIKGRFNGLEELEKRMNEEPTTVTNSFYQCLQSFETRNEKTNWEVVKEDYFRNIFSILEENATFTYSSIENTPRYTTTYVLTPNGSQVSAKYGRVWADTDDTSRAIAQSRQNVLMQTYTTMYAIQPLDPSYNCHSYAFYSQDASNPYWIDNPWAYINDGSYIRTYGNTPGNVVVYLKSNGALSHSGFVTSAYTDGSLQNVTSKWGHYGVFRHHYTDCPYYAVENAQTLRTYMRA